MRNHTNDNQLIMVDSTDSKCWLLPSIIQIASQSGSNLLLFDLAPFNFLGQENLRMRWSAYSAHPSCYRQLTGQIELLDTSKYKKPRKINEIPAKTKKSILAAAKSELASTIASGNVNRFDLWSHFFLARATTKSFRLFDILQSALGDKAISTVFVPNGRLSFQKAAVLAAEANGIRVRYYETGIDKERIFLSDYGPHDREERQAAILRKIGSGGVSESNFREAEDWFKNRESPSNQYFFSGALQDIFSPSSIRRVGIFTSTPDEFEALEGWDKGDFPDFLEGVRLWLSNFMTQSDEAILRFHPNLLQRKTATVLSQVRQGKTLRKQFPMLRILPATARVNIYQILRESTDVVVSNSSVGLEASSLGKRVWHLWDTPWDSVADVFPWKLEGRSDSYSNYSPDSRKALAFVAGELSLDFEVEANGCLGLGKPTIANLPKPIAFLYLAIVGQINFVAQARFRRFVRQFVNQLVLQVVK